MSHSNASRTSGVRARSHRPGAAKTVGRPLRWDLLMVCTAALFLVAVGRTHVFIPGAEAIRPALLFVSLGLLAWLASHRGTRSPHHFKQPLGYLGLFIVVWAGASVPLALYAGHALRYYLFQFSAVAIFFFLVAAAVRNLHDVRRLLLLYALGVVTYAFFATAPGVRRGIGAGGLDPNDSAMLVVSGLPLVLYFLLRARGVVRKAVLGIGFVLCCGAIVTSGSRGGFLALLALIVYIVFFYKVVSPVLRVTIVAMLVAGVVASASGDYWERMQSITAEDDYNRHEITGRQQLWTRGAGYMFANPVLGVGLNNFAVAEGLHPVIVDMIERGRGVKYGAAHSMWVEIGAELGIPGFLAFVAMFVISFKCLYRYARLGRGSRAPPALRQASEMAGALIGVLVALAVAGTFLSQQYHSMIWGPFGLVLGFLKVAPPLARTRRPGNSADTVRHSPAIQAADHRLVHQFGQLSGGPPVVKDGLR
jgi:O-antigen ligase